LVDDVFILSRNGGIFLLISCTVHVYDRQYSEEAMGIGCSSRGR